MSDHDWRTDAMDDDLRASDADRERTVEVLRKHHSAGRLTDDEFQERYERATGAKTLGELRALVGDLPGERPGPARPRWARRAWMPIFPLLIAALLLAAAVHGWHAGAWHDDTWHHGPWHHHWFPWPLALLLIGAWLFASRRWRCASTATPGSR